MPNTHFTFKQFTVQQSKCAMKVCTDACLFGAWVAFKMSTNAPKIKHVLDIGSGTGLLSLMLAQSFQSAQIDAVEINVDAAQQAQENFIASPWNNRLTIIRADIRNWKVNTSYDICISNPPFYENDLISNDPAKNIAHHSTNLTLQHLIDISYKRMNSSGYFAVLLPFSRYRTFIESASQNGFFLHHNCLVKQTENHQYFRAMIIMGKEKNITQKEEITIKENGLYSKQFLELLKAYYLNI